MFDELNQKQLEAVTSDKGNLLIIAGAGSGKTRVLISRIIYLQQNYGLTNYELLVVTFTNKAANELIERLRINNFHGYGLWCGTFHKIGHRIIRENYDVAGLNSGFKIIDQSEQKQLLKQIYKKLAINSDIINIKTCINFIDNMKTNKKRAIKCSSDNFYEQNLIKIYQEYEAECKNQSLVDFNEILLLSYEILAKEEQIFNRYKDIFKYIFIDEFQDTNTLQYDWLMLFAKTAHSITIVGDDDQSIYGWRGARFDNLFDLKTDLEHLKILRLEQNYRSTQTILKAANSIIAKNQKRLGKDLWTQNPEGSKIKLYEAYNDEDEAAHIVFQISNSKYKLEEQAILYRTNSQSRLLEEYLIKHNIPYKISGGVRFFERTEIKDLLAYLNVIINPKDQYALNRIINIPARGIGKKSIEKLLSIDHSLISGIKQRHKLLSGKALTGCNELYDVIQEAETMLHNDTSFSELIIFLNKATGLLSLYEKDPDPSAQSRAENLKELASAANDFAEQIQNDHEHTLSLSEIVTNFLAYCSLDHVENNQNRDCVHLMTIHAAKGLEFPCVYLCGLEQGMFPSYFSVHEANDISEERRLCYVAMTRAKQHLSLSFANQRRVYGKNEMRQPSVFIKDLPIELIS